MSWGSFFGGVEIDSGQGPAETSAGKCVCFQVGEVHELQGRNMAGLQHNGGRAARFQRFLPAFDAQAPFVAGAESGEFVLGARGAQVVSASFGKP